MSIDSPPASLTFATANDADAARVAAVLYALGFAPVRVVGTDHARPAREVALERLTKRYGLNAREAAVAEAITRYRWPRDEPRDSSTPAAPTLEFLAGVLAQSQSTAKWVRRSMLVKVGCADDFGLVVRVLSLCDAQAAPAESVTAQESPATVVGAGPSKTWV